MEAARLTISRGHGGAGDAMMMSLRLVYLASSEEEAAALGFGKGINLCISVSIADPRFHSKVTLNLLLLLLLSSIIFFFFYFLLFFNCFWDLLELMMEWGDDKEIGKRGLVLFFVLFFN